MYPYSYSNNIVVSETQGKEREAREENERNKAPGHLLDVHLIYVGGKFAATCGKGRRRFSLRSQIDSSWDGWIRFD